MARQRAGLPGPTDDLAGRARQWVEASCAAQGLPVKVASRSVIVEVAALLGASSASERRGAAPPAEAPEGRRAA
jgi:hypothetical protein